MVTMQRKCGLVVVRILVTHAWKQDRELPASVVISFFKEGKGSLAGNLFGMALFAFGRSVFDLWRLVCRRKEISPVLLPMSIKCALV